MYECLDIIKLKEGEARKEEFGGVVAHEALTKRWYGLWGRAAILA